jgi:hypothetical protein
VFGIPRRTLRAKWKFHQYVLSLFDKIKGELDVLDALIHILSREIGDIAPAM